MRRPILALIGAVLLAAGVLRAADGPEPEPVVLDLRVTAPGPGPGTVLVDRGSSDGLAKDDSVTFFPRGGETRLGTVTDVDERSAVVALRGLGADIEPGTRGEAAIPPERLAPVEPTVEQPVEPAPEAPEHPPWSNEDEGWKKDMPLLAEVGPIRPRARPMRLTGLLYGSGAIAEDVAGTYSNSFLRVGSRLTVENPFRRGGVLEFDAEIDYLTKYDDNKTLDLLVKRLSYSWGGDRFSEQRWEVGRFLQPGMPEFGVVDGLSWSRRRENGHRFGFSAGLMPRWDDDSGAFDDMQIAGWYEWVSDPREQLTLAAGYQRTWTDRASDRDLIVGRFRYLPVEGWDAHGTVWVDLYTGKDDQKSAIELTQALLSLARRFDNGSRLQLTYRHLAFPQLLEPDYLAVLPAQLADDRMDRVGLDAWWQPSDAWSLRGHASVYNDEDGTGGAAEIGAERRDVFAPGTRLGLGLYGTAARFENVLGGRAYVGGTWARARWELLYELSLHKFTESDASVDDLVQHRVRASGNMPVADTWDFSAWLEAWLYDEELSWALGFTFQKRF